LNEKNSKQVNILGIGGLLGHDGNTALLSNNKLVAASQEERFTRIKHDAKFPFNAINDCLQAGNLKAEDIDVVVFAEKPFQVYLNLQFSRSSPQVLNRLSNSRILNKLTLSFYEKEARKMFPNAEFKYSWHHLSHAIAAYYSSDFTEAAFLCIDGKAEFANASIGFIDQSGAAITHELPYANGLGMLYTLITSFLGFPSFGSEYKVMGLAPYGENSYSDKLRKLYSEEKDGAIKLLKESSFHPHSLAKLFPWVSEVLGIPARLPGDALTTEHMDIAASLQFIFEEIVLEMAAFVKGEFKTDNLLFCGGCAQNCVAAGKLRDSKIFKNIYNSPVGGDMGSGLGAALAYVHQQNNDQKADFDFRGFYLGSKPGEVTIPAAETYSVSDLNTSVIAYMAEELKKGKIIGWVHDGMELGARALGARSIIANPLVANIQSDMNLKIKFRESFRPFAPAILSEDVNDWFDIDQPSDYMQYTAFLKKELRNDTPEKFSNFKEWLNYPRCEIPSVVHVDYSARLQTVSETEHPAFYQLLTEFKRLTGVPILINTSFNVNGQPIVRTANEAWECFVNTDIDLLVINDSVYKNPFDKTKEQKLQWLQQFDNFSK
jgi:carbamoyltransferase